MLLKNGKIQKDNFSEDKPNENFNFTPIGSNKFGRSEVGFANTEPAKYRAKVG